MNRHDFVINSPLVLWFATVRQPFYFSLWFATREKPFDLQFATGRQPDISETQEEKPACGGKTSPCPNFPSPLLHAVHRGLCGRLCQSSPDFFLKGNLRQDRARADRPRNCSLAAFLQQCFSLLPKLARFFSFLLFWANCSSWYLRLAKSLTWVRRFRNCL